MKNLKYTIYYKVRSLDAFYKMLKNEPAKAFYGPKHVALAVESEAVETLLICDKLFRARGVAERRKYVEMVDKVREIFFASFFLLFCIR